jgi:hypothetical protein
MDLNVTVLAAVPGLGSAVPRTAGIAGQPGTYRARLKTGGQTIPSTAAVPHGAELLTLAQSQWLLASVCRVVASRV